MTKAYSLKTIINGKENNIPCADRDTIYLEMCDAMNMEDITEENKVHVREKFDRIITESSLKNMKSSFGFMSDDGKVTVLVTDISKEYR
jgi:predicted metal-dependent hydrolase